MPQKLISSNGLGLGLGFRFCFSFARYTVRKNEMILWGLYKLVFRIDDHRINLTAYHRDLL